LNPVAEVLFSGAPFGVGYLVAYLDPCSLSALARCLSRTVSRRTTALMPPARRAPGRSPCQVTERDVAEVIGH
jgi:hypothetical protein